MGSMKADAGNLGESLEIGGGAFMPDGCLRFRGAHAPRVWRSAPPVLRSFSGGGSPTASFAHQTLNGFILQGATNLLTAFRIVLFLFSATLCALAADSTNTPPDTLLLRNGDRLDGNLTSIDPQHTVRWKHSDVAEPIEFKLDSVSEVEFHPPPSPPRDPNFPCRLALAGGDALEGNLVSCSRETLTLQTWYAGQLRIPRKLVQSISFLPTTPDIFMLTAPDGWTQGAAKGVLGADSGRWTFRDNAFYADKSASVARDLKIPDGAEIQFDLAWNGALSLSLALYTDSLQPLLIADKDTAPDFTGFYSMRFQSMFVDVARIKKGENPLVYLPAVVVPAFSQTNRVHVDIRAQKKTGTLALTVDDQLLQVWTDTNGVIGTGTGIRFVHNVSPNGRDMIKISDLRLGPWDGVLESSPTNTVAPEQDIAWLTNASCVAGAFESLADGKLTIRDKKDHVEVPLGRVRRITFYSSDDEPAKLPDGTLHALLEHGGRIALQVESWTADGVVVHSPEFGDAKFDPKIFRKLVVAPLDAPVASRTTDTPGQ